MRNARLAWLAVGAAAWLGGAPAPAIAEEAAALRWLTSLDAARKAAAESGKFLLLDFYAPG